MHDAVAKRRRRDDALLRIVDLERDIAARPIYPGAKLPLQGEQLALQIGEERGGAGLLALAFDGAPGSRMQRLEIGDAVEQLVMPSRHRLRLPSLLATRCALIQPPIRRPVSSSVRAACS